MWNKVSRRKCLKLSCYKPEEHPFRISALEICQDADPIPQEWEDSIQGSIGSGELGFPRVNWFQTNSTVKYLVFVFYVFSFGICFLIKSVKNFVLFSLDFRKGI